MRHTNIYSKPIALNERSRQRSFSINVLIFTLCSLIAACGEEERSRETTAGEMNAGEISAGEMNAGEMNAGEMNAGEMNAGEMNAGEISAGEMSASDRFEEGLGPIMPTGCDPSSFGESALIMPEAAATQIHPDAVWDGEAFWLTWNIPNEESKFETWAGRMDCNLNMIVPPFAVERAAGMNDVDPSIAVSGDVVLIAWARDDSFTGGGEYNLTTRVATFDRLTGEPRRQARELKVKTIIADHPVEARTSEPSSDDFDEGNRWMVNVAAHPDGGFVLSGSWGDPAVNSFRVYLVHLDEDAETIGSAWLADPEGRDQSQAILSVSPRGHIDLTWGGNDERGQAGHFVRSWRGELSTEVRSFTGRDWTSAAVMRHPYLSLEEGINAPVLREQVDPVWVIGSNNAGQVTVVNDTGDESRLSGGRSPYLGVRFAPKSITGYQRVMGNRNTVWRRPLSSDRSIELPETLSVEPTVAAYPLSITHIKGGSLYLWAEGENPGKAKGDALQRSDQYAVCSAIKSEHKGSYDHKVII